MGPYRKFLRPHRRGTSPGEEYGKTPWGKSLGKPNCGFTFRRPPLGLPSYKLFPSASPPDFFTGVGASSSGCRGNCRKWFPPGRGNMRRQRAGEVWFSGLCYNRLWPRPPILMLGAACICHNGRGGKHLEIQFCRPAWPVAEFESPKVCQALGHTTFVQMCMVFDILPPMANHSHPRWSRKSVRAHRPMFAARHIVRSPWWPTAAHRAKPVVAYNASMRLARVHNVAASSTTSKNRTGAADSKGQIYMLTWAPMYG